MEPEQRRLREGRTSQPSSFQFVTFHDLETMRDAANLSRIRKHAMRDIGASRRRRSRPKRRAYDKIPLEVVTEREIRLPSPAATGFGEGAIDPFLQFPVDVDSFGRELIVNIFKEGPRALRDDWFTVCLASEHTFNQLLSNEAVHVNKLRLQDEYSHETTRAIRYHQYALVGLRTELEQAAVTDGVLGTVAGILIYAYVTADAEQREAHLKGLLGLLGAYEGGLDALAKNARLRSTISWGDLRNAFLQDVPCRLPLPPAWVDEADSLFQRSLKAYGTAIVPVWSPSNETQDCLGSALLDIFQFVSVCSQFTKLEVLDSSINMERLKLPSWVNVAIHRLLCFRSIESTSRDGLTAAEMLRESLRLALLLYLAQVWTFYGAHPVHTEMLVWNQYELLQTENVAVAQDDESWRLHLWAMCMSAFEAARLPDRAIRSWFVQAIAGLTDLQIDLVETLKSILWAPLLFDQQVDDLQHEILILRDRCQDQGSD